MIVHELRTFDVQTTRVLAAASAFPVPDLAVWSLYGPNRVVNAGELGKHGEAGVGRFSRD